MLDPFGGSGITAVEALMNNRRAITIDINPMSVFIIESLIAPVPQKALSEAFQKLKEAYQKKEPNTKEEIQKALKKYEGPKVISLPKGSDVETTDKLFSDKQKSAARSIKIFNSERKRFEH